MRRLSFALLATAGFALVFQSSFAKQIYTWTDENGVVHYVDTPPDHPDAQTVDAPEAYRPGSISAVPVDPEVPTAGDPAGEAPADELSAAEAARQELAQRRAERQAQQAEYDALCARARQQLAEVEPHRRVFFENEQGETERMDDEERVRLVEEYKAQIEKYCR